MPLRLLEHTHLSMPAGQEDAEWSLFVGLLLQVVGIKPASLPQLGV